MEPSRDQHSGAHGRRGAARGAVAGLVALVAVVCVAPAIGDLGGHATATHGYVAVAQSAAAKSKTKHLKVSIPLPNPGDETVYLATFKGNGPAPKLKLSTRGLPKSLTVLAGSHADPKHKGQSIVEVAILNSAPKAATASKKQMLSLGITVQNAALLLGIAAPNVLAAGPGARAGLTAFCNSGSAANIAHYLTSYLRGSSRLIAFLHSLGAYITNDVCGKAYPQSSAFHNALGFVPHGGTTTGTAGTGTAGTGTAGTGTTGTAGGTAGGTTTGGTTTCAAPPVLQRMAGQKDPYDNSDLYTYYTQIVASCPNAVGTTGIYYIVLHSSYASKKFAGWLSDTTPGGCTLVPAGTMMPEPTLQCNTEPAESDGKICVWVAAATSDFAPGDQIEIKLTNQSQSTSFFDQTQTVPAGTSAPCSPA